MARFKLLTATAVLAGATSAQAAGSLDQMKAQIARLNARLATLEAAPSVPAGYAMVSFSKLGDEHLISIVPSAGAPDAASVTSIAWSGYVRGAVATRRDTSRTAGQYSTDVLARANLKVVGKTDTAVGQVGVQIEFKASDNEGFFTGNNNTGVNAGQSVIKTNGFYGWWKLIPSLTLSAGLGNSVQKGTLAKSSYSFDAQCTCAYNDPWGAIGNAPHKNNNLSNSGDVNPAQVALAYSDGPLGLAVAVEDASNKNDVSAFGVSGKGSYKLDSYGFDLSGGYWGHHASSASWSVSAGVGAKFDPVTLGASIGTGNAGGYGTVGAAAGNFAYTAASTYAIIKLADSAQLELGLVHDFGNHASDLYAGATLYETGVYYTPVKQLTLGLEGVYQTGGRADQSYTADVVTIFRF